MADRNEEILSEIRELKSWLYGANGHEGDIPEIKASMKSNTKRINRLEIIVAGLVAVSGGAFGIAKLLGG